MISKGHTKTKAEKDWLEMVVNFADSSTWLDSKFIEDVFAPYNYQIDHVIGKSAKRKINNVSWRVGEFAIMPCPIEVHDVLHSNHKYHRGNGFRIRFGHEKQVWLEMIRAMQNEGYEIPFSEEVIQAIIR
jgi:hypothetical protein